MIIMAISNLVPRLPDQVLWTNAKPATAALRSKSPEKKVYDDDDTDTFPPLSLLTYSHHGGILSWWEYAGKPSSTQ